MTRTDIHSPSNFDPAEYEYVGAFDQYRDYRISEHAIVQENRLKGLLSDHGFVGGNFESKGQCDHCGARMRYVMVYVHVSGVHIATGETCADGRFELSDRAAFDRKALIGLAAAARVAAKLAADKAATLDTFPGLADALEADHHIIRDIRRRFELADGRALVLRIFPDEDASINDYEGDGEVRWTRGNDYGPVRPDTFSGAARIIKTERHASLWWEPPTKEIVGPEGLSAEEMAATEARVRRLVEEGFLLVRLELMETVTDSLGNGHSVVLADRVLGGVDEMYPDIIGEMVSEMADEMAEAPAPIREALD